jgi:hypothetical protein
MGVAEGERRARKGRRVTRRGPVRPSAGGRAGWSRVPTAGRRTQWSRRSRGKVDFAACVVKLRDIAPGLDAGVGPCATGSFLSTRTRMRGCSSAGRALQSHCRGQGFDPPQLHRISRITRSLGHARRRSVGRRVPKTARAAHPAGEYLGSHAAPDAAADQAAAFVRPGLAPPLSPPRSPHGIARSNASKSSWRAEKSTARKRFSSSSARPLNSSIAPAPRPPSQRTMAPSCTFTTTCRVVSV